MNNYVKRILACCACLVFSLASLGAVRQSTTLRTTVPDKVSLHLRLTGRGSVRIGDSILQESTTLHMPYSTELEVEVSPESGSSVKQVLWNGLDITDALQGNRLLLTDLGPENMLQIIFYSQKTAGNNPKTGDFFFRPAKLITLATAGGLLLLLLVRKRMTL